MPDGIILIIKKLQKTLKTQMFKKVFILIVFSNILNANLFSDNNKSLNSLSIEAVAGYNLGYTDYVYEEWFDIDPDTKVGAFSHLIYPLDNLIIGSHIRFDINKNNNRELSITTGFFININNPSSYMKDKDWYQYKIQNILWPEYHISYTESKAESLSIYSYLKAKKRIMSYDFINLYISGGYMFFYVMQNMYGIEEGWQIDEEEYKLAVIDKPILSDTQVLYYELFYNSLLLGTMFEISPIDQLLLECDVDLLFLLAHDFDDHPLRPKKATAFGFGLGVSSALKVYYYPIGKTSKYNPYIAFESNYMFVSISTEQEQVWYADVDNTETELDETSETTGEIPHNLETQILNAEIGIGITIKL